MKRETVRGRGSKGCETCCLKSKRLTYKNQKGPSHGLHVKQRILTGG